MQEKYKILAINPGSTSTKIAVYENELCVMEETLRHSNEELASFPNIIDQYEFRINSIMNALNSQSIDITSIDAVVGRGGRLKPLESGIYKVNSKMLEELRLTASRENHASNLGAAIANEIAERINVSAYIVDPVVVDEMNDIARLSGLPEIERVSIFHALNQKAVARKAAKELGKDYDKCNFIVAHMGGGVSVGAHQKGRVVDVNNALDGDGAFSPERSGGLPVGAVIRMCYSGKYTLEEMMKKIVGNGGFNAYLGTNSGVEVSNRIQSGDKKAELVYKAMAYQVSKDIAACAAVLEGNVDAICLTGGLAYDKQFIGWIKKRVEFIGDVMVFPGEDEMLAMVEGGLRILRNEEEFKIYQ